MNKKKAEKKQPPQPTKVENKVNLKLYIEKNKAQHNALKKIAEKLTAKKNDNK
jgi:hypothetical protein